MKRFPFFLLLLLLPLLAPAQEKRVYTVAGMRTGGTHVQDGQQATSGGLIATEGIWIDGKCNLYISSGSLVRKVDLKTGIISTHAGLYDGVSGTRGFSGDGGPATAAKIDGPYGLFADSIGNVYFADGRNARVRRVDAATGIITTIAGGGLIEEDGVPATDARLVDGPSTVYGDKEGNIYIGIKAKIRKVDRLTGIITTIAGTGIWGLSGDGSLATNAQVSGPSGMVMDAAGDLVFADRSNSRIRKINFSTGIITTIAGTNLGDSGDGGPATNAQFAAPISVAIDIDGNLIIGDNGNDRMRIVDLNTQIVTSVAGYGTTGGSHNEGVLAPEAYMHPEFLYLDMEGNLFYSNFGGQVRKITGFKPGLHGNRSDCTGTGLWDISAKNANETILYPNPAKDEITVSMGTHKFETIQVYNSMGQLLVTKPISSPSETIDVSGYVSGFYYLILKGMQGTKTLSFIKN